MWQYRELIWTLAIVDLKNRYQNTTLGFFWSILSPLLMTLVLYFVFRSAYRGDPNYAANILVGLMAWRFFANGSSTCLHAVVSKPNLVTKVYLPRQVLVLSTALSGLISTALELIIVVPLVYILTRHLPVTVLLIPLVLLVYFWFVYGIGLALSSLFVYLRDLSHVWELVVNVLFFSTPIFYPVAAVPAYLVPYYLLNPMANVLAVYRGLMITGDLPTLSNIVIILIATSIAFSVGTLIFTKLQRGFAEVI